MKRIICIILSLLAICLISGCSNDVPGNGDASVPDDFGGQLVTGLTREEICTDEELSSWIEKCSNSDRDDMFGCYVYKIAYPQGGELGNTKYVIYVYRANIEQSADVQLETYEDRGNTVARVSYTSNGGRGGYDIVKLEMELAADKKLMVEPVCDGNFVGCITTNRTVE